MSFPIILFIIALGGIILLFALKVFELRTRRSLISSDVRKKGDIFVIEATKKLKRVVPRFGKRVWRAFALFVVKETLSAIRFVYQKFSSSKKIEETTVRRKKKLSPKNGARRSEFLSEVEDAKRNGGNKGIDTK